MNDVARDATANGGIPFVRDALGSYNSNSYRGTIFGYSLGPTSLSLSFNGTWSYTWVSKIEYEKHPTLTDLYNARPGGY